MKVTVLVENSVAADRVDLRAEHGLSLHLELDGRRILFDAGAGDAFAYNAEKLGINLRDVDLAVISHHHFDHGGGLARFLAANEKAPICLRGDAPSDCRLRLAGGLVDKHIGLDGELFRKHAGRFRFIRESSAIAPGVFLLTEAGDAHRSPRGIASSIPGRTLAAGPTSSSTSWRWSSKGIGDWRSALVVRTGACSIFSMRRGSGSRGVRLRPSSAGFT